MLNILDKVKSIEDYIISFRRELHENPELSGQEYKTQEKIMKELDKLGIPYVKAGNTSLIATLKGANSGKTIALRADIDALPITEETDIDFKSKTPGVMHACGHDAHTAMLIGAAKILSEMKNEIQGEVRFFSRKQKRLLLEQKKL
jgi:amidohydrolase